MTVPSSAPMKASATAPAAASRSAPRDFARLCSWVGRSPGRVSTEDELTFMHVCYCATQMLGSTSRLPDAAHESRPWRIHEITRDFDLEDVWALSTPGG